MRVFGNSNNKGYIYTDADDPHNTTGRGCKPLTILFDPRETSSLKGVITVCSGQTGGPWNPATEGLDSVWEVDGELVMKALVKLLWDMKDKGDKPSGKKKRAVLKKKR